MAEKLGNTQTEVSGADKTLEKSDIGKAFAEAFSKDTDEEKIEDSSEDDLDLVWELSLSSDGEWEMYGFKRNRKEGAKMYTFDSEGYVIEEPPKYRFKYPYPNDFYSFLSFPVIQMNPEDEKKTASFGDSPEATEYKTKQKELFEQGKFREAVQMDIDDIHEKFGNKYDHAIADVLEYVYLLEHGGLEHGEQF